MTRRVEVLCLSTCPHLQEAIDRARGVIAEDGAEVDLHILVVATEEEAQRLRFLGSPTVRVDGHDVEPGAESRTGYGLVQRVYGDDDGVIGVPPAAWIRRALRG